MIYSQKFRLLAQEGHLAANALLSGFEGLAKSDHYKSGTIYSSLFNLTIGLERMMKITFIVHYMAENELLVPEDKELRKFSHSTINLYEKLHEIGKERGILNGWYSEGDLHYEFLMLLSKFGSTARYHNLDQITNGRPSEDPLIAWFNMHMRIARNHLSGQKLVAINDQAIMHCDNNHLYGYTMGMGGQYELMVDIVGQVEMTRLTRGHCVWTLIEIIKPLYRLISRLCAEVHAMEIEKELQQPVVPHLEELFPFGLTSKKDAIRRKAWTSVFEMGGRY